MHQENEAQPGLARRIAALVEAIRIPLLVILAVVIAGVIGYFVYAQTSSAARERAAMLVEQVDELFGDWQSEQDAQKKSKLEADLRARLETMSRDRGYTGLRSLFVQGQLAAEKGEKQAAFDAFSALAASSEGGYLGVEGLVNAAVYAEDLGQSDKALELYRRLIEKHASSPHAPHAYFAAGRLLEVKGDFTQAVATYTELRSKHPSGSWTSLAVNRIIALQASGKAGKE